MKKILLFTMTVILGLTSLDAQFTIGLLGENIEPDGWNADTNLIQVNDSVWELDITLPTGPAKFRANDDWALNWGGTDFPSGPAVINSPDNIPVLGGDYLVSLDTASRLYNFELMSPMGIIGSATPNGWDSDINMYPDPENEHAWYITLDLIVGECKFRLNDDWADNWGGGNFPMDTAEYNSPDNIIVDQAGEYFIHFDTSTLIYTFEENVQYESIGLIGSATPGGWDADTNMVQNGENPNLYELDITLTDGEVKFRANDMWTDNWGGTGFPSDTAVFDSPDNIPVDSGRYRVSFNIETLFYSFQPIVDYSTVGVVGTAVNGDFVTITPMEQVNDEEWEVRLDFSTGALLFVGNNDLATFWGAGDFPSGVAELGNAATIPVSEGDYRVRFNTITGEYNFEQIIEYDAMALVGKSGPFGEWPMPDDGGVRDFFLTVDPDDPHEWTGSEITLTDHTGASDEGVKFRADTAWTNNWGAEDFPTGIGTQDGPNIVTVAGTFDVSFNDVTGEYFFIPPQATENILKPSDVLLSPNPTDGQFTLDFGELEVRGTVNIAIYNTEGQQISQFERLGTQQMIINNENLNRGIYFIQVRAEDFLLLKKFSVQ